MKKNNSCLYINFILIKELEYLRAEKKIPNWKLHSEATRAALKGNNDRSFKENTLINEAMHSKGMVQCKSKAYLFSRYFYLFLYKL